MNQYMLCILAGVFAIIAYLMYKRKNHEQFSAYPKIDILPQKDKKKLMLEYRLPISYTNNQRAIAAKCGQMRSPMCIDWTMDPGTGDGILYLGY